MKVLITGGTGLIGSALIKHLLQNQLAAEIVCLTRNIKNAHKKLPNGIDCINSLDDINFNTLDAVVNLAGEPIADKRWSKAQKNKICQSRWQLTAQLSEKINTCDKPPEVFISGSAIGYYGRQNDDALIDENCTAVHHEFTHDVCKKWEQLALNVKNTTRVCILRTGIVLAKEGGALKKMMLPFKLGFGGSLGSGRQMMSWIHIEDMVNIIIKCLSTKNLSGVFNATAPTPVSNAVFSKTLCQALNRPCLLKTPALALQLLLGEMSSLLIYGQAVVPRKLTDAGFKFIYPTLPQALENIISS